MCIPTKNHRRLVLECYPPPKILLQASPDWKPSSSELSRLTYYASNKPAKLPKLGQVLEERAQKDARALAAGGSKGVKAKGGLIITLSILKHLITECRRSISYIARPALSIVDAALSARAGPSISGQAATVGGRDLDVTAKAAGCFYALSTFLDPSTVSVDNTFSGDYVKLLHRFADLSTEPARGRGAAGGGGTNASSEKAEEGDLETRNRTRLIGLGALSGAVASDALFTIDFKRQSSTILPALLENILDKEVTLDFLRSESRRGEPQAPSFPEFQSRRRPLSIRRAPSINVHVTGEKGPSNEDVASSAINAFQTLYRQANAIQVGEATELVIAWMDSDRAKAVTANRAGPWANAEWCGWLAETLAHFAQLPYRFVVLSTLISALAALPDIPTTSKHSTLLDMITTLLTSREISLVGLSTSDVLNVLINVVIRRIKVDVQDALLPPLSRAVSGLGTHVYYADQISDVAEEVSERITDIQLSPVLYREDIDGQDSSESSPTDKERVERNEAMRVLLSCLTGVMSAAKASGGEVQMAVEEKVKTAAGGNDPGESSDPEKAGLDVNIGIDDTIKISPKGKAPALLTPTRERSEPPLAITGAGMRNKISTEIWQQTVPLLCEPNHAVRLAYAQALLAFLEHEIDDDERGGVGRSDVPARDGLKSSDVRDNDGPVAPASVSSPNGKPGGGEANSIPAIMRSSSTSTTPLADSPSNGPRAFAALTEGSVQATRFLHALAASVYTLAVSNSLFPLTSSPPSRSPSTKAGESNEGGGREDIKVKQGVASNGSRRTFVLNVLARVERRDASPPTPHGKDADRPAPVATPMDFALLLDILSTAVVELPGPATLTLVPMLFALDRAAGTQLLAPPHANGENDRHGPVGGANHETHRRVTCRLVVARIFAKLGQVWESAPITDVAQKALSALPNIPLPSVPPLSPVLTLPGQPTAFPDSLDFIRDGETSATGSPMFDAALVIDTLIRNERVQKATGLSADGLKRWFAKDWSVESAVKESVARTSPLDYTGGARGTSDISPLLKLSSALASVETHSVNGAGIGGRHASREIGIEDLREALGGPSSTRNLPNTTGTTEQSLHSTGAGDSLAPPGTVYTSTSETGGGAGAPTTAARRRASRKAMKGGTTDEVKDLLDRLKVGTGVDEDAGAREESATAGAGESGDADDSTLKAPKEDAPRAPALIVPPYQV